VVARLVSSYKPKGSARRRRLTLPRERARRELTVRV
jgi:hypothetical protein